jgi:hypothetical protein
MHRPIVVTLLKVKLCHPSETVVVILPKPQHGVSIMKAGRAVVGADGTSWKRPPHEQSCGPEGAEGRRHGCAVALLGLSSIIRGERRQR